MARKKADATPDAATPDEAYENMEIADATQNMEGAEPMDYENIESNENGDIAEVPEISIEAFSEYGTK